MGVADARYRFLYSDVGANDRISDGCVIRKCSFHEAINENKLHLPPLCPLPGRTTLLPFFLVADDAFSFETNLMKPYAKRNLSGVERIFNYRLSRARRVVENAFGILSVKFQVFRKPLLVNPTKSRVITKACCALHNFLIDRNHSSHYIIPGLADDYDAKGQFVPGLWRQNASDQHDENFYGIAMAAGHNGAPASKEVLREELAEYFLHEGEVQFQYNNI